MKIQTEIVKFVIGQINETMSWKEDAIKNLHNSLHPVKVELNELDWKSGLSEKSERLAQHISAFANQVGGGNLCLRRQ